MNKSWQFLHICDLQPGSPRSFRFHKRYHDNWQTAYKQLGAEKDPDLLLVGGDLTRDGCFHRFELEKAREELDALAYPWHAIPGNMDVGNKCAFTKGGMGRDDPAFNLKPGYIDQFKSVFGGFPWSFQHKNIRFSGFYEALAGSGLPEEQEMWRWLEDELPKHAKADHHVMTMHYPLFIYQPDEQDWDMQNPDEYYNWYFSLNSPHRQRIITAFKHAGVTHVLSGHIHCRRPAQVFDAIEYIKCPGIAFAQWPDKWPDGDPRLGYLRFEVEGKSLRHTFVPLDNESTSTEGYGKGGHQDPDKLDYSQAWEQ